MANPLVSVIIPAHNATRYLPDAVASIRRQQYEPVEILVIDDGSQDDCAGVAAACGADVRYVRQEQAGPAAARNRGLALARGEFIAFLDADDEWPEWKLSLQLARLLAEPELDLVLGRVQYVVLEGGQMPDYNFEGPDNVITNVHLGSGLYRRRVFDRIGNFAEDLRYCEDVDLFFRVREAGLKMRILRPVTLLYRLHGSNMTNQREKADRYLPVAFQRSLQRRRRAGAAALPRWFSYDEWWPGCAPLVSVVVPVFNAARYVEEAIGSILRQGHAPVEIIAVDDGSTDESWDVVGRFGPRVRRYRQAHAGQSAARNLGVERATGKYLAFLDADDVWPEGKLEAQVSILESDEGCRLLFGMAQQFRDGGGDEGGMMPGVIPGTLLVRRADWQKVGPLRCDLKVGEFLDWMARARQLGLTERTDARVWLRRRIHGDNLGVRERGSRGDYLRVLKDAMDRRRKAAPAGDAG